jgi:hypothetical protein
MSSFESLKSAGTIVCLSPVRCPFRLTHQPGSVDLFPVVLVGRLVTLRTAMHPISGYCPAIHRHGYGEYPACPHGAC